MSRGRRYGMVKVIKEKFVVIGKEGSTSDGDGFIQKLWYDADSHFSEISHLGDCQVFCVSFKKKF